MTSLQEIQVDAFHQAEYFRGEYIGWGIVAALFVVVIWGSFHWRPPPGGTSA